MKNTFLYPLIFLLSHWLGISTVLAQTPCSGGMAGSFPCNNVDLLAQMPLNTIGGAGPSAIEGSDIWGWTDTLSGREFALMCLEDKMAFIEVTNPTNPVFLGNLNKTAGAPTTCLLYTSPSPRDLSTSRMPSSA